MGKNRFCSRAIIVIAVSSITCFLLIKKQQKSNDSLDSFKLDVVNPVKQPYQVALLFERKIAQVFDFSLRSVEFIYATASNIEQLLVQVESY